MARAMVVAALLGAYARCVLGDGYATCQCAGVGDLQPVENPFLPVDYGIGCRPHDALLAQNMSVPNGTLVDACRSAKPPEYCSSPWCYVGSSCALTSSEVAEYRLNSFYNYATCGRLTWDPVSTKLRGVPLRVAFLGPSTSCDFTMKFCRGPMADFVSQVFGLSGAALAKDVVIVNGDTAVPSDFLRPVVTAAYERSPVSVGFLSNPFQACCFAVGLGYLDLCISLPLAMGVTPARTSVVDMVIVTRYEYYICSRTSYSTQSASAKERFFLAFAPLSSALWLLVVLLLISFVLLLGWTELGPEQTWRERLVGLMDIGLWIYAIGTKTTPRRPFVPCSPPGKLVSIALALLILFVLPTYTAYLAGAQAQKVVPVPEFASIDDVIAKNATVCGGTPLVRSVLLSSFPQLNPANVVKGTLNEATAGLCNVYISGSCGCGWTPQGDLLFSLAGGFAASKRAASTARYFATQLNQRGVYDKLVEQFSPDLPCPGGPTAVAVVKPMSIADLGVPVVAAGTVMVSGVWKKIWTDYIKERCGPLAGLLETMGITEVV